jgi:hypothetical protein
MCTLDRASAMLGAVHSACREGVEEEAGAVGVLSGQLKYLYNAT